MVSSVSSSLKLVAPNENALTQKFSTKSIIVLTALPILIMGSVYIIRSLFGRTAVITDSFSLYNEGNTYIKEKKYKEAMEKYTLALALNPFPDLRALILSQRSAAHADTGDYVEAKNDLLAAAACDLKDKNGHAVIHIDLASIFFEHEENPQTAIFHCTTALACNPIPLIRIKILMLRSIVYRKINNQAEAEKDLAAVKVLNAEIEAKAEASEVRLGQTVEIIVG